MRILITNDDGIYSEGIKILAKKAKKYGEVIIIAPEVEQSAKSHAINIRTAIPVKKVNIFEGIEAYSVDSSPADCVRFGLYGLKDNFDIVFSGINRGYNLGEDILYSGTVGAAMEAVLGGKKAIAFSTNPFTFEGSKYFDEVMEYILTNELLEKHNLYNINFPKESKGIRHTVQGMTHFDTRFVVEEEGFYQKGEPHFENEIGKIESDVAAIEEGYISITPLTTDRTKYF